jgi:hypothetical protein
MGFLGQKLETRQAVESLQGKGNFMRFQIGFGICTLFEGPDGGACGQWKAIVQG